jgi:hypothetical protein
MQSNAYETTMEGETMEHPTKTICRIAILLVLFTGLVLTGCEASEDLSHGSDDYQEDNNAEANPASPQVNGSADNSPDDNNTGWNSGTSYDEGGQGDWGEGGDEAGDEAGSEAGDEDMGIGLKPGGAQDIGYFRAKIANGMIPQAEDMEMEGWLNEHDTDLPAAKEDRLVTLHSMLGFFRDPNAFSSKYILQLGMNSAMSLDDFKSTPLNLAVVIDVSGSMSDSGKLEFAKDGVLALLDILEEQDYFSLVVFETDATVKIPMGPVTPSKRIEIENQINALSPGGSTNIFGGLEAGYEQVLTKLEPGQMPRVMFLSDGLATAGNTESYAIKAMSEQYNDQGIGLTTIGLGINSDQQLMNALAQTAGGNSYFIQDEEKVADVFVEDIVHLLTPVASNLQIRFHLHPEFSLKELYGFEWAQDEDGEYVILGPKGSETTVAPEQAETGEEDPISPPIPAEPEGVAIPTLFASKKNGLILMEIEGPINHEALTSLNEDVAQFSYSYQTEDPDGVITNEAFIEPVEAPTFIEEEFGCFKYYQNDIVRRGHLLLELGLAMMDATALYHGTEFQPASTEGALDVLQVALDFAQEEIDGHFEEDESLALDVELLESLYALIAEIEEDDLPEDL